uniref:Methyltransferase-like protein 4 n=1 Tax=Photinus pyralis TaxID=7054 RepID=A0A1Y1LDX0_PHOPY
MSILHCTNNGWFISHCELINNFYINVDKGESHKTFKLNPNLFKIVSPFQDLTKKSTRKRKNESHSLDHHNLHQCIEHVQKSYQQFVVELSRFLLPKVKEFSKSANIEALETSATVYAESGRPNIANITGGNDDQAKLVEINDSCFLFPNNCRFFCKDVAEINDHLIDEQFDLIVLDPPWWNKYVRRKKAKTNDGYQMMFNDNIKELPVERLLGESGTVVVWCTNSNQHLEAVQNEFFPKWKVKFVARLFWLKVTQTGETVCKFSEPPGKQPFEQIIIGSRDEGPDWQFFNDKLIVSIPSALHSHKPPLIEILKTHLPEDPKCLEIFARYLLPNWTSWGLEAIRFQHLSVYEKF